MAVCTCHCPMFLVAMAIGDRLLAGSRPHGLDLVLRGGDLRQIGDVAGQHIEGVFGDFTFVVEVAFAVDGKTVAKALDGDASAGLPQSLELPGHLRLADDGRCRKRGLGGLNSGRRQPELTHLFLDALHLLGAELCVGGRVGQQQGGCKQ